MSTPNTGIPYVPENTQDPAAGLNLALNVIDALLQTAVINMSLTAPPGSPSDGDLYIVASGATGAWAGQDNNLARYVAEGDFWQFYEAGTNVHVVLNLDDGGLYAWTGSTWAPAVAGAGSGTVTSVDVSADTSIAEVFDTSGGPVTSSGSVSITAVDAGADRIVFWDASESKLRYLEVGSNLSITGTVLNASGGGGGSTSWGSITGTLSDQTDLQSALDGKAAASHTHSIADITNLQATLDAKANNAYTIVTEASAFTAAPGTHDGLTRYIRAAGDVTFDAAEPYTAGMVFNIRATAAIQLIEDGVTLTPPAGGTLDLSPGMAVQVVMTSSTTGDVIGQTVASS
jgi:hypothetical protein